MSPACSRQVPWGRCPGDSASGGCRAAGTQGGERPQQNTSDPEPSSLELEGTLQAQGLTPRLHFVPLTTARAGFLCYCHKIGTTQKLPLRDFEVHSFQVSPTVMLLCSHHHCLTPCLHDPKMKVSPGSSKHLCVPSLQPLEATFYSVPL